jgi:aminopeptidase N
MLIKGMLRVPRGDPPRGVVPLVVVLLLVGACSSAPRGDTNAGSAAGTGATSAPATRDPDGDDSPVEAIAADGTLIGRGSPLIDVRHYGLELAWDPETDELTGRATLDVRPAVALGGEDHPTIDLDLQPFTIDVVMVDGQPARADATADGKLHIAAPRIAVDDDVTVEVRYRGRPTPVPTDALDGVSVGWLHGAGASIVLAEPDGAHSWYPLNDHPLDKATYDFAVTVPQPLVAVANGRLERTDTSADGQRRTFHWVMDAPMAGYLASVVTGDLQSTDESRHAGVDYSSWLPTGADRSAAASLPKVVDRIAQRLGPFPFGTYGAVVYDEAFLEEADLVTRSFLSHVALETQGRSAYARTAFVPSTIVHETAHQWFGDSVSVTDWGNDIWWVEGFATFAEDAFATDGPPARLLDRALDRYEARWDHCRGTAIDDLDADELFSGPSYECGSLVFYGLWREVGDDDLWTILRTFQERHRHGNATTQDLIDVASEVAGRDLEGFMRSWLGGDRPAPT